MGSINTTNYGRIVSVRNGRSKRPLCVSLSVIPAMIVLQLTIGGLVTLGM